MTRLKMSDKPGVNVPCISLVYVVGVGGVCVEGATWSGVLTKSNNLNVILLLSVVGRFFFFIYFFHLFSIFFSCIFDGFFRAFCVIFSVEYIS